MFQDVQIECGKQMLSPLKLRLKADQRRCMFVQHVLELARLSVHSLLTEGAVYTVPFIALKAIVILFLTAEQVIAENQTYYKDNEGKEPASDKKCDCHSYPYPKQNKTNHFFQNLPRVADFLSTGVIIYSICC